MKEIIIKKETGENLNNVLTEALDNAVDNQDKDLKLIVEAETNFGILIPLITFEYGYDVRSYGIEGNIVTIVFEYALEFEDKKELTLLPNDMIEEA